ncbi:hypothetical protein MHZ92_08270 [Sporosarcina sp. ACRSL]|uniref:copper amine oxidase n=1 Tax=Sporosarcina sp. ACRSL TaxID=2918215 RepID=UPI001EF4B935|nr:hypothetical protein [Sporosarcina sp. ACRSL]MCG7344124.1 hypothetical protein [Sporosarcina sp. ACRSL]
MGVNPKRSVAVVPVGQGQDTMSQVRRMCDHHPSIQSCLQGTRHLLLSLEVLDEDTKSAGLLKSAQSTSQSEFVATYYDYTNNRTVMATGPIGDSGSIRVSYPDTQPLPSADEFELAVSIVREYPQLGYLLRENLVRPYRAMPAIIGSDTDDYMERTLAVGLLPVKGKVEDGTGEPKHQIVGVNMVKREVILYETGAPPSAIALDHICMPPPDANQPTARKGTAGQYKVTVTEDDQEIWSFLAVRPAASSGRVGSGIELRDVYYRGKKVLSRAHVPILNVRYENDLCGPYRDWQWQEGMFEAIGTDVAPGIRLCSSPPRTVLDTDSDTGNFHGVAIYEDEEEIVLMSELEAGWYRYISEWRFHKDGTIQPRFGMGAVANSCTCNAHTHHVYWRFDFDIRTSGNNVIQEINEKISTGTLIPRTINYEIRRSRDNYHNRHWLISNKSSGEGYALFPGKNDGKADSFGVGDVWLLRYNSNELDDGQGFTTDINRAKANLDKFLVPQEKINGQDVVVWYSAHFHHDETSGEEVSHIVGPELKPRNW